MPLRDSILNGIRSLSKILRLRDCINKVVPFRCSGGSKQASVLGCLIEAAIRAVDKPQRGIGEFLAIDVVDRRHVDCVEAAASDCWAGKPARSDRLAA